MPVAIGADERIRRAQAEIKRALDIPEPTEARAHGDWMKKQQSCIYHADREMRAAKRAGAGAAELAALDAEIDKLDKRRRASLRG